MEYGVISLVPPLVMLLFALKTKKSFEALILGTLVGYVLMHGVDFLHHGATCYLMNAATGTTCIS